MGGWVFDSQFVYLIEVVCIKQKPPDFSIGRVLKIQIFGLNADTHIGLKELRNAFWVKLRAYLSFWDPNFLPKFLYKKSYDLVSAIIL